MIPRPLYHVLFIFIGKKTVGIAGRMESWEKPVKENKPDKGVRV